VTPVETALGSSMLHIAVLLSASRGGY